MTDSSRETWATTTHSWIEDVDLAHLEAARRLTGALDSTLLAHMVLEIVAYADDEAADQQQVGHVAVEVVEDRISVADDGRGTDTRRDTDGAVVRKPVMATQDVRFFGQEDAPALPDGEPRRGMSTVAASCDELVHENRRHDGAWAQSYRRGVPSSDLVELEQWDGTGTTVHLRDLDRQAVAGLDLAALSSLLREFSHLEVTLNSH